MRKVNFGFGTIGAGDGVAEWVFLAWAKPLRISLSGVIASAFEEFSIGEVAHHLILKRFGRAQVKGFGRVQATYALTDQCFP